MNYSNLGCAPPRATDSRPLRRLFKLGPIVAAALALSACGGGGGDGSGGFGDGSGGGGTVRAAAEGAFIGSIGMQASIISMIILENGEFWIQYGVTASEFGFVQGTGAVGTTFTSTDARDYWLTTTRLGTVSATYMPGAGIAGTLPFGGRSGSSAFQAQRIPAGGFDYNQPALIATIAGQWAMASRLGGGALMTINVQSNGSFTGSTGGCTVSGSFVPRPSGKNVYNVTLWFGLSPCAHPNQTFTGIGLPDITGGPAGRTLNVVAVNSDRTAGQMLIGLRP